eukprot:Opistho-2@1488
MDEFATDQDAHITDLEPDHRGPSPKKRRIEGGLCGSQEPLLNVDLNIPYSHFHLPSDDAHRLDFDLESELSQVVPCDGSTTWSLQADPTAAAAAAAESGCNADEHLNSASEDAWQVLDLVASTDTDDEQPETRSPSPLAEDDGDTTSKVVECFSESRVLVHNVLCCI